MHFQIRKIKVYTILALLIGLSSAGVAEELRQPLKANFENYALSGWLKKEVFDSRPIVDMNNLPEALPNITVDGLGKDGGKCFKVPGGSGFEVPIDNEDWSAYNRITFWYYPKQTTEHGIMYVGMHLKADEAEIPKHRDKYRDTGEYWNTEMFIVPNQWNAVVWEIPHLSRKQVEKFAVSFKLQDGWPKDSMDVLVYVDQLKLEKVQADHYEGWEVGNDKIAFSHLGYKPNLSKTAIGSTLDATEFEVIDAKNGKTVLQKDIELVESKIGKFQLLDFSEIRASGTYKLKAGEHETRSFRVEEDIWKEAVWKALNYYYCQRISTEIPWYQPFYCNQDAQSYHPDTPHIRRLVPGGWFDAGDLTQITEQTAPITYLLFEYAEDIARKDGDQDLYDRIIEEGKWGLDWLLKTNFGDGYRTNLIFYGLGKGIPGDGDPSSAATNSPLYNFMVSAAEIQAHKMLKDSDPELAKRAFTMAREDWKQAVLKENEWMDYAREHNTHINGSDQDGPSMYAAWGIIAAIELFETTQNPIYKNKAIEYGRLLISCQEQNFLHDVPITGYFYKHPSKKIRRQDGNGGRSEVPINALSKLAKTFPDSDDWIQWYSALLIHSEYFTKQNKGTTPYDLSPIAVYKDTDYLLAAESLQAETKRMIEEGTKIDDNFYLRHFPICPYVTNGTSGNTSQNGTISACTAQIRGDLESEEIAQKQLQWVLGRNPFSKSMAYDIGYDYHNFLNFSKGAMVGGFALGIDSLHHDSPYWSSSAYFTSKEPYVGTTYRFWHAAMLLSSPAYVTGKVKPVKGEAIIFTNQTTGESVNAKLNESGDFNVSLPFGLHTVQCGDLEQTLPIVSGCHYNLQLNPDISCSFGLSTKVDGDEVTIDLDATGIGEHKFEIRLFNLDIGNDSFACSLDLDVFKSKTWTAKIIDTNKAWVAVVVPDDDVTWKKEAFGQIKFSEEN